MSTTTPPTITIQDGMRARLTLDSEEGLRVAVEAILAYLASRPHDTLDVIARLIATLPGGGVARLSSFSRGFHDLVQAVTGVRLNVLRPTADAPSILFTAGVRLHGVDIEGLYSVLPPRQEADAMTPTERARQDYVLTGR